MTNAFNAGTEGRYSPENQDIISGHEAHHSQFALETATMYTQEPSSSQVSNPGNLSHNITMGKIPERKKKEN